MKKEVRQARGLSRGSCYGMRTGRTGPRTPHGTVGRRAVTRPPTCSLRTIGTAMGVQGLSFF